MWHVNAVNTVKSLKMEVILYSYMYSKYISAVQSCDGHRNDTEMRKLTLKRKGKEKKCLKFVNVYTPTTDNLFLAISYI